jgi:hypothetical protein
VHDARVADGPVEPFLRDGDISDVEDVSDDEEEKVVNTIAPVLLSVLRDNPSLISTLRKASKEFSKEP